MFTSRWVNKKDMVHIPQNTSHPQKKEWNNAICSNTERLRDYHTKWSKPKSKRQIPYDITYAWNLKYGTNKRIYETDSRREQPYGCQGGRGQGKDGLEFGISRCKQLYIEWINNKVQLYSIGICIQCPKINHNGREYKRECNTHV